MPKSQHFSIKKWNPIRATLLSPLGDAIVLWLQLKNSCSLKPTLLWFGGKQRRIDNSQMLVQQSSKLSIC